MADRGGPEDEPVFVGQPMYPLIGVLDGGYQDGNARYRIGFLVSQLARQQDGAIKQRDAGRVIGDGHGIEGLGEAGLDLIALFPGAADLQIAILADGSCHRFAVDRHGSPVPTNAAGGYAG